MRSWLVRAELAAGAEEAGTAGPGHDGRHGGNESFGIYLLAAARKPWARKPATRPSVSRADRPAAAPQAVG